MSGELRAPASIVAIHGQPVTLQAAADAFLSSPRCENPNTRRAYAAVIDKVIATLGPNRQLADVDGDEFADVLQGLWDDAAASTWNRNRAAIGSWLSWCERTKRWNALALPAYAERRREHADHTRSLPRRAIERQLSRRAVPLREKTLWRMLYETAARASEILALDVERLDLANRRAPVRSKGGEIEWVHWGTGTAHVLPRMLRLPDGTSRTSGPLFLSERKPPPARLPPPRDVCPHTGRVRLGYDRARVLLARYTGWRLHQLRHSAATHLGEKKVPLQLIMAKTRHRSPRNVMRYVNPGPAAVAEVTELLDPPRRLDVGSAATPEQATVRKVVLACKRLLQGRGADLAYARRLPDLLRARGLRDVAGEGRIVFGCGGSPASRLAAANYSQVAEEMIRQNLCTSGELRSALELLADPEFGVATHLLISAWGRRPS